MPRDAPMFNIFVNIILIKTSFNELDSVNSRSKSSGLFFLIEKTSQG